MSDKTHIEWTDATWNPVTGCSKVSAGCKHCYAERDWARLAANPATRYYGRAFTDVRCHGDVLDLPERWQRPRRIFVNSMSDLFHDAVPDEFIDEVFAAMARSPQHVFQILTKRPARMLAYLAQAEGQIRDLVKYEPTAEAMQWPLPAVHLGVSIEDQPSADERISQLLQTPAAVRWISAEPLLAAVDLRPYLDWAFANADMSRPDLGWVVAGGESGPHARPMHPDWVRSLRDQCAAAGVPFLFKQWGEWAPDWDGAMTCESCGKSKFDSAIRRAGVDACGSCGDSFWLATAKPLDSMCRVGKKAAGRLLDGVEHNEYPS